MTGDGIRLSDDGLAVVERAVVDIVEFDAQRDRARQMLGDAAAATLDRTGSWLGEPNADEARQEQTGRTFHAAAHRNLLVAVGRLLADLPAEDRKALVRAARDGSIW